MLDNELSPLIRDRLYAELHGLLNDDVGRSVGVILSAGIADRFSHDLLRGRVARHKIATAFQGDFALPELPGGDLILGLDVRGDRVTCPLQFLNAHALTLGGSGSGKTTKSRFMALQVVPRVRGAWLIDLRKKEYAALRPYLARLDTDLIVLPARLLRFNPLQVPDGVEPLDWAANVADMLLMVL